ncbi:MAG: hypothetical protein QG555_843 [Thermodesulfobacteriota bacterium]|jgi:hypothetical protein|nr:hypothetical protein [Thermodesulfobacteriota bacterium]
MKQIESINLPNGLSLEVWDASRQIAADTVKVELVIKMDVSFASSHFEEEDHYLKTRRVFGPAGSYEYRKERTFVHNAETETVFRNLLNDFKRDALPYLAQDNFPRHYSRSKYRDIVQNPYKYQDRLGSR